MPSLVSRRLSLANPRQFTTHRRRQHSQLAITTCFFVVENLHFAKVFSMTWMVAGNPISEGKTLLLRPYDIRHYSPFIIKMMLQVLCATLVATSSSWLSSFNEGKIPLL